MAAQGGKMTMGLVKQQAVQLESGLKMLRQQISALAEKVSKEETARLRKENEQLSSEVSSMKQQLVAIEIANGVKQVPLPKRTGGTPAAIAAESAPAPREAPASDKQPQTKQKKEKKEKPAGGAKGGKAAANAEKPVDISRLYLRVGLIKEAIKHPNADGLYIETVDLGEEKPRTIISGLVKFVPIEQMQQRLAVFMVNFKPVKMRGVFSEGMIMCASTPEKVEILDCPEGAKIGDQVACIEYPGDPDVQLNPKKKVWEQIQPELVVAEDGIAKYKGAPLVVDGLGPVTAPFMRDCPIK